MSIWNAVVDFVSNHLLGLAGGIWAVVGLLITYLAKKYLVPFLQVEKRRRYAVWIAAIADEITDDLRLQFPGEKWIERLDEAVDQIMEICGIEKDIAQRAIRAAAARKN